MIPKIMKPDLDAVPEQLELSTASSTRAARLAAKRESLQRAVNSTKLNTTEERVAWVLNHYPKTRDSDINLQIRYWQQFESEHFGGGEISVSDYYRLTRLTTITRARAFIQNQLELFQASDEVQRQRKQIEKDEKQNAVKKCPNCRQFSVYMDESGKTQDHLIVGSVWYLNSVETIKMFSAVEEWKKSHSFGSELHFRSITESKLPHYCELADLILKQSAMLSFKAISVPRRGISDVRFGLMMLSKILLERGIEHELSTGRTVLPRRLSVCKDSEETGADRIFVAELSGQMKQAAETQFHGELHVGEFYAEESATNVHLQIADLFTSSVGRRLNAQGERAHAKDRFAEYLLDNVGYGSQSGTETVGDVSAHLHL